MGWRKDPLPLGMAQALILAGGWDGHKPMECSRVVAEALKSRGLGVQIETSLAVLDSAANLKPFAVIIPNWTMGELKAEQSTNLLAAVAGGTGLAGWHGGVGDAFRGDSNFQFATGGQFVAHPGNIIDYTVSITDREHPITRGLPATFAVKSEQYYMHTDPANHVLATTAFDGAHAAWVKGCVMPAAWVRRHDRGRVFYQSVGHSPEDLANPPVLEMTTRGVLWAAGLLQ